jgi:DNA-binding transcriptional LysR family regulator
MNDFRILHIVSATPHLRRPETTFAVTRLGGLHRAAGELGTAPSAAALHLSALERELGGG